MTRALLIALAATIVLAALPLAVNSFGLHVLTICLYYTILAASWNLLAGMTGQFSLAHQAFAAIGAYTSGLLTHYYGIPVLCGVLAGTTVSGLLGLILGRIVLRMRAIYLAIATWAFAETVHILLTAAYNITRGELGLTVPALFASLDPLRYYWLFAGVTVASVLAMWAIVRSPMGYFMRAIKDDELRAASFGVDTTRVKVAVFAITGFAAAAAGIVHAGQFNFGSANDGAGYELTAIAAVVIGGTSLFGGAGSMIGTIAGSIMLGALANILQLNNVDASLQLLATGAIIVLAAALQTMVGRREGSMR